MLLFAAGQGDRHYIKMLLCKVKGATCFADLKIYNGHSYASFREACAARGLLDDDDMHDNIMEECAQCQMIWRLTLFTISDRLIHYTVFCSNSLLRPWFLLDCFALVSTFMTCVHKLCSSDLNVLCHITL